MMELGPHAGFILASYGAVVVVLGVLSASILLDHRAQSRALDALEKRGAGRRSGRTGP